MKVYAPNSYPRESIEFQNVDVWVDGTLVITGIEFCVVTRGARPVTWVAAPIKDGRTGIYVGTYAVGGEWVIWARATASPEFAVIDCGYFTIT